MLARALLLMLVLAVPVYTKAKDSAASALFIVHFETGDKWDNSLQPAEQAGFQEHSTNLNRLRHDGTIVFGARYGELGVIILEAESLQAAASLIEADPGVQSGIFDFNIEPLSVFYPWRKQR